MNERDDNFDLTAEYIASVAPLINQLHAECVKLGLPMVIAVKYLEDSEKTGSGAACVINERAGIQLAAASRIVKGEVSDPICALVYKVSQDNEE